MSQLRQRGPDHMVLPHCAPSNFHAASDSDHDSPGRRMYIHYFFSCFSGILFIQQSGHCPEPAVHVYTDLCYIFIFFLSFFSKNFHRVRRAECPGRNRKADQLGHYYDRMHHTYSYNEFHYRNTLLYLPLLTASNCCYINELSGS